LLDNFFYLKDRRESCEKCRNIAVVGEKTRHQLEMKIVQLQQQLDSVSRQSAQNEAEMKLALNSEKQAHNADVDRLTADKVFLLYKLSVERAIP